MIGTVPQRNPNEPDKETGVEMSLSDKTVKNYLSNALEKLNLNRRSQAAVFFIITQTRQARRASTP